MKQLVVGLSVLAALALGGCSEEPSEAPNGPATTATPAAAAPVAAAETAATPTAEQVAVPEDFEAELEQSITAENLETELARVEAEMANEAP